MIQLTASEKLWVMRKRRGETQRDAARFTGVGRGRRRLAENGSQPHAVQLLGIERRCYATGSPGRLSATEQLRLARRRARPQLSLAEVARLCGVTRVTILKWERAGSEKLFIFWRRRGFTFARS